MQVLGSPGLTFIASNSGTNNPASLATLGLDVFAVSLDNGGNRPHRGSIIAAYLIFF